MAHRCLDGGSFVSDANGTYIVDAVDDGEVDFDFESDHSHDYDDEGVV